MPKSILYLAWGLISLAGLGFLGGIIMAGYFSLWIESAPQPAQMPAFVSQFVTAAGAVLGTNLGAALGIRATFRRWRLATNPEPSETLRIAAAFFYAGCLVLALVLGPYWLHGES